MLKKLTFRCRVVMSQICHLAKERLMTIERNNILELIAKSFTSKLSEEEIIQIDSWKSECKENLDEYNDYKDLWEKSKTLYFKSSINSEEALAKTRRNAGINNLQIKWRTYVMQAAAVLILSVFGTVVFNQFVSHKTIVENESTVYQHVKAAFGTQSKVELSDGTIVYINSGSELSFPNSFSDKNNRKVKLSGEAYFTVAKNKEKPFIVETNKLQVKVLGTSFNVDAYPDNSDVIIALVEGQIAIQHLNEKDQKNIAVMKPNQIATYNINSANLCLTSENDLSKYIDWKEGKIVFSNDPINIVMKKLENWYNVEIELANKKLEKYRFTGTFINEPIENILSILSMTSNMKYKIYASKLKADKSYSRCKIVLTSK